MKSYFPFAFFLFTALVGCNKCYVCTATQEGTEISQEVCGRNATVAPLIEALETDNTGVGPWVCTK
jgi:hypothetical protein